jgi:WW domain-containing oxidoreductase
MQVNLFSHMHLTLTLLPNLLATPHSRLVWQSSDLHRAAPSSITFTSLSEINTDIGPAYLYNRSKLAQILFIRALVRRQTAGDARLGFVAHKGKDGLLYANATHPGAVSTDQQKQAEDAYGVVGTVLTAVSRPFMADPVQQGCRPALFAATGEDVVKEGIVGQYIVPDRKVSSVSSQAEDEGLGENLWRLGMEVLREKLGRLEYEG